MSSVDVDKVQRNVPGNPYVKNYEFDFEFPPPWGRSHVVMTSVLGHLTQTDFGGRYSSWQGCSPAELFDGPIITDVAQVDQTVLDPLD